MRFLVYDTETTDLPLWNDPSEDPRQPHIVELAAILIDDESGGESIVHSIIKPDGWIIENSHIHGITTERALAEGRPAKEVLSEFFALWRTASFRLGHNESFDARMLRIAWFRHFDEAYAEEWKRGSAQCTQRMATPIMKLPPSDKMRAAGRFHHKSANLTEAHVHFCGGEFEGAHGAMADARACLAVWRAIKAGNGAGTRAATRAPSRMPRSQPPAGAGELF